MGPEDELLYGIEGRPAHISFKIRAHPEPTITWYFHNQRLLFSLIRSFILDFVFSSFIRAFKCAFIYISSNASNNYLLDKLISSCTFFYSFLLEIN